MARKVFISYRREDAKADARSIYQRLERTFGTHGLFMDVDTIERGRDFRTAIDSYLADSAAILVLIGRNWHAIDPDARTRRLDAATDFVRIEVASALKRDIPVIPVLVDGAGLPAAEELPEDIRPLVFRQAARVSHESFASDMDRIERDLLALLRPRRRIRLLLPAALVAVAALLMSAYLIYGPTGLLREPGQSQAASTKAVSERAFTSFEVNTDRPGGDYTSFRLPKLDALSCQKLCAEDQRCLAWTYVAPGYQETSPVCWLKNAIPAGVRTDVCCTSGVAYYRRPK